MATPPMPDATGKPSAGARADRKPKPEMAASPAVPPGVDLAKVAANVTEDAAGLIGEASANTLTFNPLIGLQPQDIFDAGMTLMKIATASPDQAITHYGNYLQELGRIATGKSDLAPEPRDRRFAHEDWTGNVGYRMLMQAFLAGQKQLGSFVDASDLPDREKGQARFFTSLVTDALAPTNWLFGNPAAVQKTFESRGTNLVHGLENFVHDMRHNNMMPSQVDATPFKVGVNVAVSPGRVVYRHEMFELLQYEPTTPDVHKRPMVMSPPQVNKFYAVDLTPEKSLLKWAVDSGIQMFVISWRNPTAEHADWGLENYVRAIDAAVDAACEITGSPDVNMWGSCSGGMCLAAYLGWLAGQGLTKVANTSWGVCILDMNSALEDSTLGLFNSPATIRAAKGRSGKKGYISGDEMASMFAWLRPNDLIWNYWVNNYLMGNKPPAFDILAWNADTTRLPARYHSDLLDIVSTNPYVNPDAMSVGGVPIDMRKVKVGAYVIAGITDHITPWRGCYGTARMFGADSTFVLANAGHLQSLVNPPGSPKSYFLAAPSAVENPVDWARSAQGTRTEGSWWPHWRQWIQQRSGEVVAAPATLGSVRYPAGEAAPGLYVMER